MIKKTILLLSITLILGCFLRSNDDSNLKIKNDCFFSTKTFYLSDSLSLVASSTNEMPYSNSLSTYYKEELECRFWQNWEKETPIVYAKTQIQNNSEEIKYISFDRYGIEDLSVYFLNNDTLIKSYHAGKVDFTKQKNTGDEVFFQLPNQKGNINCYYICRTLSPMSLKTDLCNLAGFEYRLKDSYFSIGLALGAFGLIMIYNLFMFLATDNKKNLIYVPFHIALFIELGQVYHKFIDFNTTNFFFNHYTDILLNALSISIICVFSIVFLNIRKVSIGLYHLIIVFLAILGCTLFLLFLEYRYITFLSILTIKSFLFSILIVASFKAFFSKRFLSKHYLAGSFIFLLGSILHIFGIIGVLPISLISVVVTIGIIIEIFAFTFGIAYFMIGFKNAKILAEKEANRANQENFTLINEQKELLTQKVKERTIELEEQRHFFENILDNIPIEIAIFDENHHFLYVNKKAFKNNDMKEWVIGKTEMEYIDKRGLDSNMGIKRKMLRHKALLTGECQSWLEVFNENTDNEIHYMRHFSVISRNDVFDMIIGYGFDVTELKQKEKSLSQYSQELERSNQELEQFAHLASHDLKTPLRVIHSFLQIIEKRNKHNFLKEDFEYIGYIYGSIKNLSALIEDMLKYAKIDKNLDSRKKVEVKDLIFLISNNIKSFADEKNATIEFNNNITLYAHTSMIYQLLTNFIINGIKYNKHKNPKVKIGAFTSENGNAIIEIEDNGIGIEENQFENIFKMFRRAHDGEYEGTGIGLAICKKIVDFYQGSISVESKIGEGSRFKIMLPKLAY